jgi:hypothetical protein
MSTFDYPLFFPVSDQTDQKQKLSWFFGVGVCTESRIEVDWKEHKVRLEDKLWDATFHQDISCWFMIALDDPENYYVQLLWNPEAEDTVIKNKRSMWLNLSLMGLDSIPKSGYSLNTIDRLLIEPLLHYAELFKTMYSRPLSYRKDATVKTNPQSRYWQKYNTQLRDSNYCCAFLQLITFAYLLGADAKLRSKWEKVSSINYHKSWVDGLLGQLQTQSGTERSFVQALLKNPQETPRQKEQSRSKVASGFPLEEEDTKSILSASDGPSVPVADTDPTQVEPVPDIEQTATSGPDAVSETQSETGQDQEDTQSLSDRSSTVSDQDSSRSLVVEEPGPVEGADKVEEDQPVTEAQPDDKPEDKPELPEFVSTLEDVPVEKDEVVVDEVEPVVVEEVQPIVEPLPEPDPRPIQVETQPTPDTAQEKPIVDAVTEYIKEGILGGKVLEVMAKPAHCEGDVCVIEAPKVDPAPVTASVSYVNQNEALSYLGLVGARWPLKDELESAIRSGNQYLQCGSEVGRCLHL